MKAAPTIAISDEAQRDAALRLNDAFRDAISCAAVLAKHFELLATRYGADPHDDSKMFAAMGHEDIANNVIKQLREMQDAAYVLWRGKGTIKRENGQGGV